MGFNFAFYKNCWVLACAHVVTLFLLGNAFRKEEGPEDPQLMDNPGRLHI